jgi:hypothetical protein
VAWGISALFAIRISLFSTRNEPAQQWRAAPYPKKSKSERRRANGPLGMKRLATLLVLIAGCGPFASSPGHSIDSSGSGPGTASGTWTDHFLVSRAPWQFIFHVDCAQAARGWNVDLTLEKMYPRSYYQPVPIDVGWSQGSGPVRATVSRRITGTGEFWFIVRTDDGCTWRLRAPAQ